MQGITFAIGIAARYWFFFYARLMRWSFVLELWCGIQNT